MCVHSCVRIAPLLLLPPLPSLLPSRAWRAQVVIKEQAAAALAKLAAGTDEARALIAKSGGIQPLVSLLDGRAAKGSELTQQDAAAALAQLAVSPANIQAIDRAGGVSPLVGLLGSYADVKPSHTPDEQQTLVKITNDAKRHAAAALARLSQDSSHKEVEKAQRESKRGARESKEVRESSAGDFAREGMAAQGGLAAALASATKAKAKVLSQAEKIADKGAIVPLVAMLAGSHGPEAQEEAAGALWALADFESNRLAITETGGIGPLVSLLACDNPKAREHAEGALVRLSIETANRVLIIKQVGFLGKQAAAQGTAPASYLPMPPPLLSPFLTPRAMRAAMGSISRRGVPPSTPLPPLNPSPAPATPRHRWSRCCTTAARRPSTPTATAPPPRRRRWSRGSTRSVC